MSENKHTPGPVCALCHKPNVTADWSLCYGCGELICDDCDRSPPMGKHGKEDHLYDFSSYDRSGRPKMWQR